MLHKASSASVGEGMIKNKQTAESATELWENRGQTDRGQTVQHCVLCPPFMLHIFLPTFYFKFLQFFSIHLSIFSLTSNTVQEEANHCGLSKVKLASCLPPSGWL